MKGIFLFPVDILSAHLSWAQKAHFRPNIFKESFTIKNVAQVMENQDHLQVVVDGGNAQLYMS